MAGYLLGGMLGFSFLLSWLLRGFIVCLVFCWLSFISELYIVVIESGKYELLIVVFFLVLKASFSTG